MSTERNQKLIIKITKPPKGGFLVPYPYLASLPIEIRLMFEGFAPEYNYARLARQRKNKKAPQ